MRSSKGCDGERGVLKVEMLELLMLIGELNFKARAASASFGEESAES